MDDPRLGLDVVETTGRRGMAVAGHQTGIDVHPDHHEEGTDQEGRATTPLITPNQSRHGHTHVDHVLDTGGDQVVVALQAGHSKDVGNVVH